MKLYWTAKSRGDGYTEWWEYTCPSCETTISRNADPPCCCPACGVRIHGSIDEYNFKTVMPPKKLVQKYVKFVREFDTGGFLVIVDKTETETEVPPDDPAQVFYRRHNLV